MSENQLRCIICGSTSEASDSNVQELHVLKQNGIYICLQCQAKIKFESDKKYD